MHEPGKRNTGGLHYLSLLEVSERIRRREISAAELTRSLLDRIERVDQTLHSFITVLPEAALAEARRADREIAAGNWRGPLHGVPLGVKDVLCMEGTPTTAGMPLLRDYRPTEDAEVIRRLRRAGAVLLGKLHLTEGATYEHHALFPRPVNPWSAAHHPGLSSSGAAVAVAAGLCYGAIASDTAGSIRVPCAANGASGTKPTRGRVSRTGLLPLAESLDTVGTIARTAEDAAAMLQVIAGHDPEDPTSLTETVPDYAADCSAGAAGLVMGVDWRLARDEVSAEVLAAFESAVEVFRRIGVVVREVTLPDFDAIAESIRPLLLMEMAAAHARHFAEHADQYGPGLRGMLERARYGGLEVVRSYQARERFSAQLHAALDQHNFMLLPALSDVIPTWDEFEVLTRHRRSLSDRLFRFTTPLSAAGVPTLSLPCGFTAGEVPLGVQLAAPRLAESSLFRAGAAFQQATDFHLRRPPAAL
jgi:amidase